NTYYWRLRALGALNSEWTTVHQVTPSLTAPMLISPLNQSQLFDPNIVFEWSAVADATDYQLQISYNPLFTSGVFFEQTALTNTITIPFTVQNVSVYWRVRAKNGALAGIWSSTHTIWSFKLNLFPAPVLTAPAQNAIITATSTDVAFTWDAIQHVTQYQIQISLNTNNTNNFVDTTLSTTNYTYTLTPNVYYWRIRGVNGVLASSWSPSYSFSVVSLPPPANLLTPMDNLVTTVSSQTYTWDAVEGATSYRIQISPQTDFYYTTVFVNSTTPTPSFTYSMGQFSTYYWRVQA
ncbi:MAG TPA: hypothetical protein PLZ51_11815, partial [Aggregatilineales bacterium]|nr:hypothetical protein [Aggregatilineales bacterium]